MFFKVAIPFLLLSFFDILAAAAPGQLQRRVPTTTVTVTAQNPAPTTISQCNTGDAQCCNTVTSASTPGVSVLTGLLGIVIQDVTALVGFGCSPITVIGLGQGANCAQQPVCCQNNNFNGLINIGCTPVSL